MTKGRPHRRPMTDKMRKKMLLAVAPNPSSCICNTLKNPVWLSLSVGKSWLAPFLMSSVWSHRNYPRACATNPENRKTIQSPNYSLKEKVALFQTLILKTNYNGNFFLHNCMEELEKSQKWCEMPWLIHKIAFAYRKGNKRVLPYNLNKRQPYLDWSYTAPYNLCIYITYKVLLGH